MIRRSVAVALVVLFPGVAAANPGKYAFEYTDGETIHIANQGGAINRHRQVRVSLELTADGKLAGSERGKWRLHNLYERYSTDETSEWTHTWGGTWTLAGPSLRLDLVLEARQCTRSKKMSDGPVEPIPCGKVSKQIQLACTSEDVTITTGTGPRATKRKHPAWQCVAAAGVELDKTPSLWMLGKSECIRMSGGPGGPGYELCTR
jgi:hypothetical protein